eukprot:7719-Heterococcus_DN1.PRE.3
MALSSGALLLRRSAACEQRPACTTGMIAVEINVLPATRPAKEVQHGTALQPHTRATAAQHGSGI